MPRKFSNKNKRRLENIILQRPPGFFSLMADTERKIWEEGYELNLKYDLDNRLFQVVLETEIRRHLQRQLITLATPAERELLGERITDYSGFVREATERYYQTALDLDNAKIRHLRKIEYNHLSAAILALGRLRVLPQTTVERQLRELVSRAGFN